MKKALVFIGSVAMLVGGGWLYYAAHKMDDVVVSTTNSVTSGVVEQQANAWVTVTERYGAQVDRVLVLFEQVDYVRYRLQTNGLVRTGELNTERGFENDDNATVYILNWQKSEGERMYYVRLTSEPTHLYVLDSARKIIKGSALTLQ